VKFSFSSEQEEFRSNLRRFLADRSPTKEVRRLMETDDGYERDSWRSINAELGLTAVRIPEAYGGQGFGFGEQCIVLEEMGRALLCAPFFATAVLAAGAILNAGTETEKQALLARHRRRRDDRDFRLGRGQRTLGRRGHGADRDRGGRRDRAEWA